MILPKRAAAQSKIARHAGNGYSAASLLDGGVLP